LVIGSANAGKTTIMDKVCHAKGRKPDCFNMNGKKVRDVLPECRPRCSSSLVQIASELKPSASVGIGGALYPCDDGLDAINSAENTT